MKFVLTWIIIVLGVASFVYIGKVYFPGDDVALPSETQELSDGELELETEDTEEAKTDEMSSSEEQATESTKSAPVQSAPTSVKTPAPTSQTKSSAPDIDENGYYVVRYTNNGFEPFIREIRVRDTIRFVNESDRPMWVTASYHPYVPDQEYTYPEFKQPKSVYKGGEFVFTFIRGGTWGYKNLNNEDHLGAVVVLE